VKATTGSRVEARAQRKFPAGLHAAARRSSHVEALDAFALVSGEMAQCEALLHEFLGQTIPAVAAIGQYLAESGGKRLRPLLTALGARAAGNTGDVSRLMCVGEMLHLGSLLHDDVVDDGQERRGRPAAQKVYGNAAVILTGDVCVARGLSVAAEEAGLEAVTRLAQTVAEMSEGEVTQLVYAGAGALSRSIYFEVVDKKSASLMAWCVAAGAWADDAPRKAEALARFGRHVGCAFQITDDVLDIVGDSSKTGKIPGRDLAEGKMTLPVLIAIEKNPDLYSVFQQRMTPEKVVEALAILKASGAPQQALALARDHVAEGIAAIATLEDSPAKDSLIRLAHHLVERVA
jgi:octaprenyl-diphosphate synthase